MPRKRTIDFDTVHRLAMALIDSHVWPSRRIILKRTGGGSETVGDYLRQIDTVAKWKLKWGEEKPPRALTSIARSAKRKPHAESDEIAMLRAEIAELKGHLKSLSAALDREAALNRQSEPSELTPQKAETVPTAALAREHPLYGLSMPEAAAKQLAMLGEEATLRQITAALLASGYKIAMKQPESAVRLGLKRRAERQGDVILVGRGKWGMRNWYSAEELNHKLSNLGKEPGRDFEHHRERVLVAQAMAREKGVRLGRETFEEIYPYEKVEHFRRLRAAGVPIPRALNEIGMPRPTYKKYKSAIDDSEIFGTEEKFLAEAARIRTNWPLPK